MNTCHHCKAEHQEPVKFCTKCGMKMRKNENSSSSHNNTTDVNRNTSDQENKKQEQEKKPEVVSVNTSKEKKDSVSEDKKPEDKKDDTDTSEEDPFVYKFDNGDDKTKKSGDGVWLAIVAIVVIIAIIIIGTSRKNAQEEQGNNNESVASSIIDQENGDDDSDEDSISKEGDTTENEGENSDNAEDNEEVESDQPEEAVENEEPVNEVSGPSESASSTLIDTSALRFDYSSKQVKDKDFSTAWIEAERDAGINETITINYGEEKEISRIGIVPGYGRDGDIYNENNRVKKLTLEFSDGSIVEKDLEDRYAMHMLDFDQRKTSSIKITIKEVYSGSKYNDTAISEIDIESDYVTNNDPDGAMRFYEENKKDTAKKPL